MIFISQRLRRTTSAHIQAVFGAESSVMYGWCSAVFEGEVVPFFFFLPFTVTDWGESNRCERVDGEKKKSLHFFSKQPLVQSVHHSCCVSVLSFIITAGELSCSFTLCDKTADRRVHFNHATTASSTFTTFIYILH